MLGTSTAKWGDTFSVPDYSLPGPDAFSGSQASGSVSQPPKYGSIFGPISAGLQVAQGVLGYMQSEKEADAYHDSYKAIMARSGQVMEQGLDTAIDIRQEGARFLGTQMAAGGKSGSAFDGSLAAVAVETQRRINKAAERRVEQARRDARALYYQAKAAKKAAKSARRAGIGKLVGSIGGQAAGSLFNAFA